MNTRWIKVAAGLAAVVLLVASCGDSDGGGGSSADPELVAALTAELASDDSGFPADVAECSAEKIVNGIGADRLSELGVTVDNVDDVQSIDFTDGELDTIVDSFDDCKPLKELLAEEFSGDGTFSEADAKCLVDELPDNTLKDAFRAGLSGADAASDDFNRDFLDAIAACDIIPE